MAVQGPDYCKETADQVMSEILLFLKEEHGIHRHDPISLKKTTKVIREEDISDLKRVIHNLFMHQSWEDW